MKIELPSGQWVEVRDKLTLQDKWAISQGIEIQQRDGVQYLPMGIGDLQMKNFLASVITEWSFPGIPVPSQNIGGAEVFGNVLDLDDWDALEEAVQPLFEKARGTRPNRQKTAATTPSSNSSPS